MIEGGKEVPLLDDVALVFPEGSNLRMTNLFGEERVLSGRIKRIDLLNHRILIEANEAE
jgi:predicted RNA-binding protein